ncbi:MAG: DinB family protein, partial [Bacteroidota bacterium]
MSVQTQPEVWLRGPIEGIEPLLQPVAHALLQMLEDVGKVCTPLTNDELWGRPG